MHERCVRVGNDEQARLGYGIGLWRSRRRDGDGDWKQADRELLRRKHRVRERSVRRREVRDADGRRWNGHDGTAFHG